MTTLDKVVSQSGDLESFQSIRTETQVKVKVRTALFADKPYIEDDGHCLTVVAAADSTKAAAYNAVASVFVRHIDFDNAEGLCVTGTPKERAKVIAKAARKWFESRIHDGVTGSISAYISTLSKAVAYKVSIVAKEEDGKPVAVVGWSYLVKTLADVGKVSETADKAFGRALAILENHAGSKYSSMVAGKADALPMLDALLQCFGRSQLDEMLDSFTVATA